MFNYIVHEKIDYDYVYKMIMKIYINTTLWMLGVLSIVISFVMPINFKMRGYLNEQLTFVFISVGLTILAVFLLIYFIRKLSIPNETKLFLLGLILVVLFCVITLLGFPLNNLTLSFLILGIVMSIFVFKIVHQLILQSLCYITLIILMTSDSFAEYILPQRIIVITTAIVASFIASIGRTVMKQLIDKLLNESEMLRSANEDVQKLNDELEDRVQLRTMELEAAMQELQTILEDLQNAQDRLMRTKSMESFLSLARKLSHQINTPLGVTLTSVSYIKNIVKELKVSTEEKSISQVLMLEKIEEMNNTIDIINENIDRSIKVVEALKRFTLYEPMKLINLSNSLYVLQSEMNLDEFYKQANITITVDPELEFTLPELTFHKIIRTIVDNSISYSQTEPLNIQIAISETEKRIKMEISDNGVGIPAEKKDQVFEPFFTTDPHKLGMGLFIAESIVHHTLNGKLYLDSDYNDGTKITFVLLKESVS